MYCINALCPPPFVYEDRFYTKVAKTAKAETWPNFVLGDIFLLRITLMIANGRLHSNGLSQFEISDHQCLPFGASAKEGSSVVEKVSLGRHPWSEAFSAAFAILV
jgi:hypothetical protein